MTDHLEKTTSSRGFNHLPYTTVRNQRVGVYESSNAVGPHVWLAVDTLHDCGAVEASATIELTTRQAWQLAEQLALLVREHYQCDARPHLDDRVIDFTDEFEEARGVDA